MKKFGRLRGFGRDARATSPKPKRLMMGLHPIPTMVTLGNLLCGFASIVLAMRASHPPADFYGFTAEDCLKWSAVLIFVAMVFDVMDGKVARWTKSASKFGMEMDSLCDVVSFGVAPAVLVKAMIDQHLGGDLQAFPLRDRYIWPLLAVYVCCAALRLARYNVESESGHRDFFFGMPSPGAAGCVASLALLIIPTTHYVKIIQIEQHMSDLDALRRNLYWPVLLALPFVTLGLGVLMVSRVHYPHLGDRLLRGRKSFRHVIALGLALVLIIINHEVMLAVAFNGYMLFGLLNELRFQVFPSQRPAEWVSTGDESVPPEGAAPASAPAATVIDPSPSLETPAKEPPVS